MTITQVENKILTMLETLKWTWKPFNNIYNYFTLDSDTFPYVWFELVQEDITQVDTCNDFIEWFFHIYCFQEVNIKDNIWRSKSREIINKWTQSIKNLFEKNYTMDWEVINSKIQWVNYDSVIDEKGVIYYSKITLKVELYNNINIL